MVCGEGTEDAVTSNMLCQPQTFSRYLATSCSSLGRRLDGISSEVSQRPAVLGMSLNCRSQKYYKLRKEADGQAGSPPTTPKKRKASDDNDEERKKVTPSKRPREAQREAIDGIPLSDISDSPPEFKAEEMAASVLDSFSSHHAQYTPAAYYPAVNMDIHLYGQISGQVNDQSGGSSFMG